MGNNKQWSMFFQIKVKYLFTLKNRTLTNTFCNEPNNVTGLCNRNSCPLSNSRYATIIEKKGVCYLKIKTAERAHTPKELWELVKLDPSYNKSLEQIDKELEYWPKFLKHKCKQRFTRIRQVLVKKKKMKLEGAEEYKIHSRKAEKREKSRLIKAEKSAVIENHIAEELLKNLKNGKYEGIYNFDKKAFQTILEREKAESDKEEDFNEEDYDKGYIESFSEDELNENESEEFSDENINNNKNNEEDDFDDIFNNNKKDNVSKDKKTGKKRKRGKTNLEYEREYENNNKEENINVNDD